MRLLVTGCRGFIGSVFCRRAMDQGHEVYGVDDESRGLNPSPDFLGDHYIKHDCRKGFVDRILGEVPVPLNAVVHLAAATGSLERPIEELRELNVAMTKHVYEDALKVGAQAFAWPTTSLFLGVPDSPYVQSKEEALKMLKEVDAKAKISVPVRFFNVAGSYGVLTERRKREVHVVPRLVECFKKREPFVVNGSDYDTADGTPSRDFVNVNDVVEYLLFMIGKKLEGETLPAHPTDGAIWTGTGYSMTVLQMVDAFTRAVGLVQIELGPRRAFDCARLTVDPDQRRQFEQALGGLVPASLSIRDEARTLARLA